jgi:hypothetical protein
VVLIIHSELSKVFVPAAVAVRPFLAVDEAREALTDKRILQKYPPVFFWSLEKVAETIAKKTTTTRPSHVFQQRDAAAAFYQMAASDIPRSTGKNSGSSAGAIDKLYKWVSCLFM